MDPLDRFEFSQSSLQDFADCPRRFQLRYLQRVAWPAIQAEPALEFERHMQRGERFHRLAQQYLLGMPAERLTRMAEADEDEHLLGWWQNFLDCIPASLDGARYVEVHLSVPLDRFRLVAVYDLVLIGPDGRVIIYDWKTSLHRPKRATLLERLQTRVYPYVLAQAGAALNGGRPFTPEQIEMIYWFTEPSQAPERLAYTAQRCAEDEQYLLGLVHEIQSLGPQEFKMPDGDTSCGYCVYRSLCSRGTQAGDMNGAEEAEPEAPERLNFDFEQIGEIGF